MTATVKHDRATNSDEYLLHWAHNTSNSSSWNLMPVLKDMRGKK